LRGAPPILIATAPRYLALAQWTIGRIEEYWPEHSGVFISGAEGDSRALPLRDDPADWMRLTASACRELIDRGFDQAYLILDDHPPIARCHADFLASEIPEMLQKTNATVCTLMGPGPVLKRKGEWEKIGELRFEKLPLTDSWKLGLHPALWNLSKLLSILEALIEKLPPSQHHPWAFERIGSSQTQGGVDKELLASCWRVDGWESATPEARRLHDWRDSYARATLRLATIALRPFGKSAEVFKERVAGLWHPRLGAYPCFWSGVMKKGALNSDYFFYSKFKNRPGLVAGLQEAFAGASK
jgi:hypothetical protein